MLGLRGGGRFRGEITEVTRLTPRVVGLSIRTPDRFGFHPGQYIAVSGDLEDSPVGYFSIASAPNDAPTGIIQLAVSDGASLLAGGLDVGAVVWIEPPAGELPYRRLSEAVEVVLIGMGTGIAPLRAVLRALRHRADFEEEGRIVSGRGPTRVHLIQGARSQADCLFYAELSQVQSEEFVYWPVFSGPDDSWTGRRGRVQDHLAALPTVDAEFCLCGSSEMVKEISGRLAEVGVSPDKIYSEGYS